MLVTGERDKGEFRLLGDVEKKVGTVDQTFVACD